MQGYTTYTQPSQGCVNLAKQALLLPCKVVTARLLELRNFHMGIQLLFNCIYAATPRSSFLPERCSLSTKNWSQFKKVLHSYKCRQVKVIIDVTFYSRYGDIVLIPDTGWFVTSRSDQYRVRNGLHGYDNNAKTMRVSVISYADCMIVLLDHRLSWLLEDLLLKKTMFLVVLIIFNYTI